MNNINSVLEEKMCCGCGACPSVCPTKCIDFIEGRYVNYPQIDESKCIDCGLCKKICPGQSNITRLVNKEKIDLEKEITSIKVGYSGDDDIRFNSASGGAITQIIIELLDNEQVDCAVVVTQSNNNPLLNEIKIINNSSDVILAQGSRYSPASNCIVLRDIINNDEYKKVVFVGKPCDIEAVSAYEKINVKLKEKIFMKISIMCHHAPTRKGLLDILKKIEVKQDEVNEIKFRGGGWPGKFSVTTNDGKVVKIPYFEAWGNYLSQDDHVKCMYCENPFPMEADIVVGDPWGEEYKSDPKGQSLIIIRNKNADNLIKKLEEDSKFISNDVSYKDVERYQKNLLKRYSEFNLTSMLFKRVHGYKITVNDVKSVVKDNPKDLLRYFKRIKSYKNIHKLWKYE